MTSDGMWRLQLCTIIIHLYAVVIHMWKFTSKGWSCKVGLHIIHVIVKCQIHLFPVILFYSTFLCSFIKSEFIFHTDTHTHSFLPSDQLIYIYPQRPSFVNLDEQLYLRSLGPYICTFCHCQKLPLLVIVSAYYS